MAEIKAGQLAQLLATLPVSMPVVLEGTGPVTEWRGEVRDGKNVLVLFGSKTPVCLCCVNNECECAGDQVASS